MILRKLGLVMLMVSLPLAVAQGVGHLPVRAFGFQEGLTNLSVNALVQDSDGFLLAGTESGVFRFNGRRFEALDLGLPSRYVTALLPDPDGRVWVGTRSGLGYLDRHLTRFEIMEGLEGRRINYLGLDAGGRLWVLAGDRPFVAPDRHRLQPCPDWPGVEPATSLFADPDSPRVEVTGTRSLWTWDPKENRWLQDRLPLKTRAEVLLVVGRDGEGALWVRSSRALYRKLAGQRGWLELAGHGEGGVPDNVQITRDREGWVWTNTLRGLLRCRGKQILPVVGGLSHAVPISALVDREGSTWLVSIGISQVLASGLWEIYGVEEGLPSDVVWNVATDRQGRPWVATDGGLVVGTPMGWRLVKTGQFSRIHLADDGFILAVGSPGGTLYRIDPVSLRVEAIRVEALPATPVSRGLAVEPDGTVWVSDFRDGVASGRRERGRWVWQRLSLGGHHLHGVWQVLQGDRGAVFLATREGLYLREHGSWSEVGGTLPESPFGAFRDGAGDIWVYYFDRPVLTRHHWNGSRWERVETWAPFAGRDHLVIFSHALDAQGHLWVGTSQGLGRLDLPGRRLDAWYSPGEGIPGADATLQGLTLEANGDLWFGTTEGVGRFHTAAERPLPPLQAPRLLKWTSGGTPLAPAGPIPDLEPDRPFEVWCALNAFARPGGLSLQARLSGVDSDWVQMEDYRILYGALPPGAYQLEVRGFRQPDTAGPSLVLAFKVRPHWWQTAWARLLEGLGLAALLALAVHLRHRSLRRHNEELQEIVVARTEELRRTNVELARASKAKSLFLASMSHELRTPLSAILLYSELVAEEARERGDEGARADLEKIQAAGRHLLSMINGILDLSKIEAGKMELELGEVDLPTLVMEVLETLRPVAEQRGNRLQMNPAPSLPVIWTDATKVRQILLNLGGNACKFTRDGTITFSITRDGEAYRLEVADTGEGMPPEVLARVFGAFEQGGRDAVQNSGGTGLGLAISQRLAQLLGGEVTATSRPGQGSTFTVRLPGLPRPDLEPPATLR